MKIDYIFDYICRNWKNQVYFNMWNFVNIVFFDFTCILLFNISIHFQNISIIMVNNSTFSYTWACKLNILRFYTYKYVCFNHIIYMFWWNGIHTTKVCMPNKNDRKSRPTSRRDNMKIDYIFLFYTSCICFNDRKSQHHHHHHQQPF